MQRRAVITVDLEVPEGVTDRSLLEFLSRCYGCVHVDFGSPHGTGAKTKDVTITLEDSGGA